MSVSITDGIPDGYNEQFAAWVRLEPRCRSENFSRGLEARTADPLWMLARQWQTGEFTGEDAGSPLQVQLKHSTQSMDLVKLGRDGESLPMPSMPLETMVEAESSALNWRARVQIGQQFERIIHSVIEEDGQFYPQALVQSYRDEYPLIKPPAEEWRDIDAVTRRYIMFMVDRVIDGEAILENINNISLLGDMTQVLLVKIINTFNDWSSQLNYKPEENQTRAWRNQQLDYEFELFTGADTGALDLRAGIQLGQLFEQIIHKNIEADELLGLDAQTLVQAYRDEYTFNEPLAEDLTEVDTITRRYIEFMVNRVIDGKIILGHISNNTIELLEGMTQGLLDQIVEEFQDGESPSAKTHLVAPDYRNGLLDWYTLYANTPQMGAWQQQVTEKKLPTQITVGGTSPRWWAFEDSATDFGKLDVAKPDLAKLLLMEFVLIYGDDWFSVPLPTKMPNLVRIDNMKVLNVFGDEPTITPVRQNIIQSIIDAGGDPDDPLLRWETYALAKSSELNNEYEKYKQELADGGLTVEEIEQREVNINEIRSVGDLLFIPPVAGFREESKATEEVRFIRDEGANMVWGVENIVQNGVACPISGFDEQLERSKRYTEAEIEQLKILLQDIFVQLEDDTLSDEDRSQLEEDVNNIRDQIKELRDGRLPTSDGAPQYRLATTVPENWIPFIPTSATPYYSLGYESIRLRRAQMLRNKDDEEPTAITAMTSLLEMKENPLLWLEETAVSRSGLRVLLTNQRIRWIDGKTYVWSGRKVTAGKGEGSSGLKFDFTGIGI